MSIYPTPPSSPVYQFLDQDRERRDTAWSNFDLTEPDLDSEPFSYPLNSSKYLLSLEDPDLSPEIPNLTPLNYVQSSSAPLDESESEPLRGFTDIEPYDHFFQETTLIRSTGWESLSISKEIDENFIDKIAQSTFKKNKKRRSPEQILLDTASPQSIYLDKRTPLSPLTLSTSETAIHTLMPLNKKPCLTSWTEVDLPHLIEDGENLINQSLPTPKGRFHLLGTFSGKMGDLTVTILKTGPWSFEEDFFLIHSLEENSNLRAMTATANVLKRTLKACKERYTEINPKKRVWSRREKAVIRTFISSKGITSQIEIARILHEKCGIVRSLKQINSYLQDISS